MHLPRRKSGARLGDGLSAVVWSLAESWLGGGEFPGTGGAGDGHACLPHVLAIRAINDDPAVSSDGGLLAKRARRRDACVETLVQQTRALIGGMVFFCTLLNQCTIAVSHLEWR